MLILCGILHNLNSTNSILIQTILIISIWNNKLNNVRALRQIPQISVFYS